MCAREHPENQTSRAPGSHRALQALVLLTLSLPAALLLAGCPNAVPVPGSSGNGPRLTAATATSSAPVSLSVTPTPPKSYVPTTFTVISHPTLGPGATVTITLTMPSMAMPPTLIATHPLGNGVYRGAGSFTMPGDWKAQIAVLIHGKQETRMVSLSVR